MSPSDDKAYRGTMDKLLAGLEEQGVITKISLPRPPLPPPPTGRNGGNPHNDPMDPRIANIEARLTSVETKLEHIDREVSTSKWWVAGSTITIVLAMVATVLGTGVAIQQMTVATFQAAGQQAAPAPQPPIIINVPGAATAPAAPASK